ncbi:uncharacterized protein EHS24_001115 [Apiotrichum porosum]|uniref:Nuclear pore complex protein Nup160 n=1 Tax=Apiotrichum porosum TaxID=105984 RepID=A0A427YBR9_9TREE|nr:uncharacterized protein EHS24_001115 [Apiotrichum porosum]RSH88570.1 hypothetical protein EHS24_001115 [Apiotrichum porosum]
MSLYSPHSLVHAHLPALPTVPGPVAEVSVPSERPFADSTEIYSAPLHPDHAVSAAFDPRTATLARVVHNGYALELRSLSPVVTRDRTIEDPSIIRILFPDALRPLADGCIVPSVRLGQLVIVVLTETNVIYRLSFNIQSFTDRGDRVVFTTKDGEWVEEWEIDPDVLSSVGDIGSWAVTNEDTVILGCADGGIVKAVRSPSSSPDQPFWSESQHRGASRLRFFSRATDELVTSIAKYEYQDQIPVLYTYSRDSKLRTWSAVTGQCLKTLDVRISSTDLIQNGSASKLAPSHEATPSLIRVIAHPSPSSRCSHIVVVFVPTPYDPSVPGTFVFYRAANTSHGANDLEYAGERPGSSGSAGSELRGFEIQPPTRKDGADGWRLWAVWDSKGTLSADSVLVNDILQFTTYHQPPSRARMVLDWQKASIDTRVERYDNTYFDNLIDLEAADPTDPYNNSDITAQFLAHLFYPGRFSELTLVTALDEYIDQLPLPYQDRLHTSVYPSLSKRFEAAVGSALHMGTSSQTGAPEVAQFRKDLKQQWQGIWARVRELDKQARWPVASSSVNGQLLILDRDGASVPIHEDAPGVLVHLGQSTMEAGEFQTLPEGSLVSSYPNLAAPQARRALCGMAVAGESLTAALQNGEVEGAIGSALDALVDTLDGELAVCLQEPVESLAGRVWDERVDPFLKQEDRDNLQLALSESTSVSRTLSDALDILTSAPPPMSTEKVVDAWAYSGFGNALLTSTIMATIAARHTFARDVLLIALYYLSVSPDLSSEDDEAEELIETLARALAVYHRYRVLQWLSEQTGEEAAERARARRQAKRLRGNDDVLAEFDSLRMREGDDEPTDVDGYDTAYSLMHSLLARVLPQPVPVDTVARLSDSASAFLGQLGLLKENQIDIEPRVPDVKLAYAALADGHSMVAREMTELYPLSSGLAFVRGRALLEADEIDEGVRHLELAAAGTHDGSLAAVMPTCVGKKGLGEYYRRVMAVVDEYGLEGPVARFGTLALQSIESGDINTRDIWTRVFLAYIALGQYEDAYSTITSAPFHNIKRDLLGQLISAMCESNQVGRLNRLGFIGFQKDVEERLNFKARNSDPLRTPNYYKVLYSWHISRGDYRSAGEIMYAQGQRFAEASTSRVSAFELSAMRAQSYLAAINALALVDKRNAWISVNSARDSQQSQKRRRVTKYIPNDEFSIDNRPVSIVTLDDIRGEYTAVVSQLRLCQQIPDLYDHGVSLSSEEIVGFFTQRSMFDQAQSSAAAMGVDMTDLFATLATRCVELARMPGVKLDNPAAAFLASSPVTARLRGPPAALALRYLQIALERHDSLKTEFKYTDTVADVFFGLNEDANSGWQVPAWLVDSELSRDPEGWISRALSFGWVREAVGWTAEVLSRVTPPDLIQADKPSAVDVPYNLIDRVLAATDEGDEKTDPATQAASKQLRHAVELRTKGMKRVARIA